MYNESAPEYNKIALAYLYGRIFVLTHNTSTVTVEQIYAWGDALGMRRDYWTMALLYYGSQISDGNDAPLLCPPDAAWQGGYQCARSYVATHATDSRAYAATAGVPYALVIAGYGYYAFDDAVEPDLSGVGLLAVLINLLSHL